MYSYTLNGPADRIDPYGLWTGVDDAAFAGGGALVGVLGQAFGDLASGKLGGWEDYAGAAIGGAIGGESLLYGGPVVAGTAGAAATNLLKQGLKNLTGEQCGFDPWSFGADTSIGALTGALPGLGLSGISAGRNSYNAIYKQMTSKLKTGQISNVSAATAAKMAIGRMEDTGAIPGLGAATAATGLASRLLPTSECLCPGK
ncbi:MAG: hypothetical protein GDA67_16660 [Nitrospira sp. CR1.3]|nr:hypothetical protein [Nitrospira sp. CR1.3]